MCQSSDCPQWLESSGRKITFLKTKRKCFWILRSACCRRPYARPPRACYMVPPADEPLLRERLLSSQMAVLLAEEDIALRPDGRPYLNGLFAVWHRHG